MINIFIGYDSDASNVNTSSTNQIVIGADALGNGNNTTTIGNDDITQTYLKGKINVDGAYVLPETTGSAGEVLKVPASGNILEWGAAGSGSGGASKIDELSDAHKNTNKKSIYLGTVPANLDTSGFVGGMQNVSLGVDALKYNTSGRQNVAIGYEALTSNQQGYSNVAIGDGAMKFSNYQYLTRNVAIGLSAGSGLETNDNIAIGSSAISSVTSGSGHNVAIGDNSGYWYGNSGYSLNSGSKYSIFLGAETRPLSFSFKKDLIGFSILASISK